MVTKIYEGEKLRMAIESEKIKGLIKESIPDAEITIEDLKGDGDHYAAIISSREFQGLSRVQQHQLVYKALGNRMGNELHALSIQTKTPETIE
jgi:stress-induced morphogen|tara:strand:+ start:1644 stop:1922 length:279 start_codon:yes stop_codon:yes gene_type:complete